MSGVNEAGSSRNDWQNDPLSHPEIQKMTQRQLADLPYVRPNFKKYCE